MESTEKPDSSIDLIKSTLFPAAMGMMVVFSTLIPRHVIIKKLSRISLKFERFWPVALMNSDASSAKATPSSVSLFVGKSRDGISIFSIVGHILSLMSSGSRAMQKKKADSGAP